MKVMNRTLALLLLVFILCNIVPVILLSACYAAPGAKTTETPTMSPQTVNGQIEKHHPAPSENILILSNYQTDTENNGVYFTKGQTAWYRDLETGHETVLCEQTGCAHSDASCTAWQGNVQRFGVYRAQWYAVVQNEDESLSLRRTDPQTNRRKELYHWECGKDERASVAWMSFSYGRLFLLTKRESLPESLEDDKEEAWNYQLISVELEKEQADELDFSDTGRLVSTVHFFGGTEEKLYVLFDFLPEPFLQAEDFSRQHPEMNSEELYSEYSNYIAGYSSIIKRELWCYDLSTWEPRTLVDRNLAEMELPCVDADTLIYWTIDPEKDYESRLYALDLRTEDTVELVVDSVIMNAELFDGKVTFIVSARGAQNGRYYWIDKNGGTIHEFLSLRDSPFLPFVVWSETNDYLLGNNLRVVRKDEYYSDTLDWFDTAH